MPKRPMLIAKPAMLIALMAGILGFAGLPAYAAEDFYTFKSVLSTPAASWCIDVPGAAYNSGTHLAVSACSGKSDQVFGYEGGGTLTAGGYCVDGLAGAANKSPSAGDPVGLAECDGSDHQVWQLQPFSKRPDVFAIANPDGLCVTVDGAIAEGVPLVLAQCAELDTQGWVTGKTTSVEPEYYIYAGHRYCWYDEGWHGLGWYWCGENLHQGIGWGGPIGWHWWHHHGHPWHPHHPHHPPHLVAPGGLHIHGGPHFHGAPHPHFVLHPKVMKPFAHPHAAPHLMMGKPHH